MKNKHLLIYIYLLLILGACVKIKINFPQNNDYSPLNKCTLLGVVKDESDNVAQRQNVIVDSCQY